MDKISKIAQAIEFIEEYIIRLHIDKDTIDIDLNNINYTIQNIKDMDEEDLNTVKELLKVELKNNKTKDGYNIVDYLKSVVIEDTRKTDEDTIAPIVNKIIKYYKIN